MMRARVAGLLAAVVLLGPAADAPARTGALLSYPFSQIWPTAVRFLRIDRNATIREKDAESGYVLFDLPEAKKTWKGALELVRAIDPQGREACRVVITFPDLPRHYESSLLDGLAAKVREEHGDPAPPPPPRPAPSDDPPPARPDAGARQGPPSSPPRPF